jgi:hypothetical protein
MPEPKITATLKNAHLITDGQRVTNLDVSRRNKISRPQRIH